MGDRASRVRRVPKAENLPLQPERVQHLCVRIRQSSLQTKTYRVLPTETVRRDLRTFAFSRSLAPRALLTRFLHLDPLDSYRKTTATLRLLTGTRVPGGCQNDHRLRNVPDENAGSGRDFGGPTVEDDRIGIVAFWAFAIPKMGIIMQRRGRDVRLEFDSTAADI
jgi:hypothetical protein